MQINKDYLIVIFVYFVLSIIFFAPLYMNITNEAYGSGGDLYQALFFLWNTPYSIIHGASIYYTNLLYFPIGANLAAQTIMPLAGLLSAPLDFNYLNTHYICCLQ